MADTSNFDFLSIATHQLRTPLTAMNGYLKMIEGGSYGNIPDQLNDPLQKVVEATSRMRELVNILAEIHHIDSGRTQPALAKFNMNELMAEAADFAVKHALAKQISIKVPNRMELTTESDYRLCQQIISQYLRNAVLYSNPGNEVALSIRPSEKAITVEVHDNGIGIPQAEQDQVFQGYFRASNTASLEVGGNGLGLFLARKCADLIKLQLNFESTENNGSVFRLIIPTNYATA